MRIGHAGNYASIFAESGGNIVLSDEFADHQDTSSTPFGTDAWVSLEIYVYSDPTNGVVRIWKNGVLADTYTGNTYDGSGYNTILYMSYWNGGSPSGQSQYIDDVVITTDTPSNVDAQGNHMIGPTNWGSGDTQAPTVPTNLSATAVSSSQINLTWTASTDNVGVVGYDIYRCAGSGCTPTVSVGTSPTNSYSDTGLSSNTYVYAVDAYDAVPNTSAKSSTATATTQSQGTQTVFFTEHFDDANVASRGWTWGGGIAVDTTTKEAGAASAVLTWPQGANTPTGNTGPIMHEIVSGGTDKLYVSFYWRFNSNWVGSGTTYHPHIIQIQSNLDVAAGFPNGMIPTYGDSLIEVLALTPRLHWQDSTNINSSRGTPPNDLTTITENRDTGGCNCCLAGSDCGVNADCYNNPPWYNMRHWSGSSNFTLSAWHFVEAYFQMNTIVGGKGAANGIMWMKVDGSYVYNSSTVVFRTNQNPTMKWEAFFIGPYIGVGSPQAQTMWMDELTVADSPPSSAPPTAPTNLRIVQ